MSKKLDALKKEFEFYLKNWDGLVQCDEEDLRSGESRPRFGLHRDSLGDRLYAEIRRLEFLEHTARLRRNNERLLSFLKEKGCKEVKNWDDGIFSCPTLLKLPGLDAYVGHNMNFDGETVYIKMKEHKYSQWGCKPSQFSKKLVELLQLGMIKTDEELKQGAL